MDFLVVDDDPMVRSIVKRFLLSGGRGDVRTADGPDAAVAELERAAPDVVILDYSMPGVTGLELLERVRKQCPDSEVIMLTAHDHVPTAVQAIRLGAFDYLVKPLEPAQLEAALDRMGKLVALRRENDRLRARLGEQAVAALIGEAPVMAEVRALVARAAARDSTVLVTGEHGTGKELVARTLHDASPRARRPFVPVECSSVSGQLFESELFGHIRGAFTGADRPRKGLCQVAGEGSLFLDEVAEIPVETQAKLLRVLQEREFRPVGANDRLPLKARVIAATNVAIERAIAEGRLREDLYYRLNVIRIELPPLRARREDVPALADHFFKALRQPGDRVHGIADDALERLAEYDWPGNVRELKNTIERAIAVADDELIHAGDLALALQRARPAGAPWAPGPAARAAAAPGGGLSAIAAAPGSGSPRGEGPALERGPAAYAPAAPAAHAAPGGADLAAPGGEADGAVGAAAEPDPLATPMTLEEMERLMIRRALGRTRGNVAVAASHLGVSPSTIYRKLKTYGMDVEESAAAPA